MKRILSLMFLMLVLFSLNTIEAYQIVVNATSDLGDVDAHYRIRIWDLNDYHLYHHQVPVTASTTINFNAPGDYVLYGACAVNSTIEGHFYYGEYDELSIISLTEENPIHEINIHINEGHAPHHFTTYETRDINGHSVIPIFQDFVYSVFTKQLVYENDNNELMLIGYQLYTPTGWETTILDQEYLYLDNNAQPGDSFNSYNYLYWEYGDFFAPSQMTVLGVHEVTFNGETHTSTAVRMEFQSMMDIGYTYWYEFTGTSAPLLRNGRYQHKSTHTIYNNNYSGEFNGDKLLNLLPETETIYEYISDTDPAPKKLDLINNTLYWYPWGAHHHSTYNTGYKLYWETNLSNETVTDSINVGYCTKDLEDLGLGIEPGNYSFWVRGMMSDGTITEPSNVLTYSTVANDSQDTSPLIALHNNYPNPFNPETTISFNLDKAEFTTLEVYNIKGQKVKTLINGYQTSGEHNIVWNGKDDSGKAVASGVYLYKMKSGEYSLSKKMILHK